MTRDRIAMLELEREGLLNQWTRNEGDRLKLLVRIMEIEEQIDELKKGA
ncbi:MAG TPA: chromosome segregation protein SMC [Thermoanaerobacterales bacterium]|nr:chromosome segregation protein SMC [Tepidanaerobacter sp. GT38]MCG1010996.1 chromosome segregation protein SMC [Tepidanaerobacter sp. GT38]HHY42096.1 chromosome segregation protein SMC [Thermoanaerobacterales bacterium]